MTFPRLPNIFLFQLLKTSFILQFSSTHSCDAASLTLACLCRHCPVNRLLLAALQWGLLACQGHIWVLDNLSHCSGKSQAAQQKELQSHTMGQALWAHCLGWWQEKIFSIFVKSLQSKGPIRHSCAESTVTGGFNSDTSNAHSAVSTQCSWAAQGCSPLPFLWTFYRGEAQQEPGLAGRKCSFHSQEWSLGPGCLSSTRQLQFLSLCIAEGSRMFPASGVKWHVLNYWFSVARVDTSHLFPTSPKDSEGSYMSSKAYFYMNLSFRRSSSDYWVVLSIAVFKKLFKPVSGRVWSPSHVCGLSQLESLPLESLHFLQLWLDSQDLGSHHQVGPSGS